jgi:hypothetical protein
VKTLLALVPLVVALAGAASVWAKWRAAETRQVRGVLVDLRRFCGDVTAAGGLNAPDYLTEEARRLVESVGDLADAVHDHDLARRCQAVLAAYTEMWANSPPRPEPTFPVLGGPSNPAYGESDRMRAEQNVRQVDAAHRCADLISEALARVNRLERWVWWQK